MIVPDTSTITAQKVLHCEMALDTERYPEMELKTNGVVNGMLEDPICRYCTAQLD
jgi:hypothetical protein